MSRDVVGGLFVLIDRQCTKQCIGFLPDNACLTEDIKDFCLSTKAARIGREIKGVWGTEEWLHLSEEYIDNQRLFISAEKAWERRRKEPIRRGIAGGGDVNCVWGRTPSSHHITILPFTFTKWSALHTVDNPNQLHLSPPISQSRPGGPITDSAVPVAASLALETLMLVRLTTEMLFHTCRGAVAASVNSSGEDGSHTSQIHQWNRLRRNNRGGQEFSTSVWDVIYWKHNNNAEGWLCLVRYSQLSSSSRNTLLT